MVETFVKEKSWYIFNTKSLYLIYAKIYCARYLQTLFDKVQHFNWFTGELI